MLSSKHGKEQQVATTLLAVSADVYFLTYILASRRVRDTFSDFPAATHS